VVKVAVDRDASLPPILEYGVASSPAGFGAE